MVEAVATEKGVATACGVVTADCVNKAGGRGGGAIVAAAVDGVSPRGEATAAGDPSVDFTGESCRCRGDGLKLVFRCIGNGFSFFGGGGGGCCAAADGFDEGAGRVSVV